jgi:para-aminobenzoate synthetase
LPSLTDQSIHSDLGQLVLQNFLRLAALEPARSLPNAAIPDLILAASATARHEAEPAVLSASPKRFKLEIRRFNAGNGLGAQRVFETLVQGKAPGDFWLDSAMVSTLGATRHTQTFVKADHMPFLRTAVPQKNNHDASPSYSYLGSRAHTLTYSTETGLALLNTGKPAKPLACDAPFFNGLNALQQALAAQTAFPTAEGGPDWKAGWVGWMGYGLKSETLPGYGTRKGKERQLGERPDAPDACLSFVRTVLALDHTTSDWLAIGLVEMGSVGHQQGLDGGLGAVLEAEGVRWASTEAEWEMYLGECEAALAQLEAESRPSQRPAPTSLPAFVPDFSGADYIDRICTARGLIHSGESYELTLTTQFRSTLPADRTPYDLYLTLRASNPAPYSTFINLPELDVAVVSSSPERFIKLGKDGTVEMKPIKGTVARVKGDPVSDEAVKNALQNDRKEIAENLMVSHPCGPG